MPADRAGSYARVGSQFELAAQQVLHSILVHDQHHQIDCLGADLQTEAAAFDGEEGGSAPALGSAAAGDTPSIAGAHDKSPLEHGGNHGHAFGRPQNFFWNSLIRG